jgi:hypothetical protein
MQKMFKLLNYSPLHEETQSGIVAVRLNSLDEAGRLKNRLSERKVIVVQRKDYLRISAHASATQKNLDVFFEELENAHHA